MKRILLGALSVLAFQFVAALPASAVEIPPTDECQTTFKTGYENFVDKIDKGVTDEEERRAERRYFRELVAAGCLSDIEPIFNPMRAKPRSATCSAAATAADEFWRPLTRRVNTELRAFNTKVTRPHKKRLRNLHARIARLKRRGGPERRIDRLQDKELTLRIRFERKEEKSARRIDAVATEDAYASTLIFYEFISLRCIDQRILDDNSPAKDLPARVYRRNEYLIWASLFHVFDVTANYEPASSASTGPEDDAPSGLLDGV